MKNIKLFTILFAISLFLVGCDQNQPQETAEVSNEPDFQTEGLTESDNDYWARENLDLQAVGTLFEKSDNIEDFERNLNSNDGINNLDLNGDGYADYLSVAEYDDRYDDERGFSLFSKFDGDSVQEIARIVFDRDNPNQRGSRIMLSGNEQIYGNNYNYQGNWLDKGLAIADWVFGDRNNDNYNSAYYDDGYYSSPYYYDNYPDNYEPYRVVETPVYRQRITTYPVDSLFVRSNEPFSDIRIQSPYRDRSYDRVYARLAEPTEQQLVFIKNNPRPLKFDEKEWSKAKKADKKFDKFRDKQEKFDDRREDKIERKLDKAERKVERKVEKQEDKAEKRAEKREDKMEKRAEKRFEKMERKQNNPSYDKKADKGNKGGKGKHKGNKKGGKH